MPKGIVHFLLILIMLTACGAPRDPEGTWAAAHSSGLRIGVAAPDTDSIHKDEVATARRFAAAHDLEVTFIHASESELVRQLKRMDIHLIVGGFDRQTPWREEVGTTRPLGPQRHVVLVPSGENRLLVELETWYRKNTSDHAVR